MKKTIQLIIYAAFFGAMFKGQYDVQIKKRIERRKNKK